MFKPNFIITPKIASDLMEIEGLRKEIINLPITTQLLISLRETARLQSTHYSTMIEGNRLTEEQVEEVIVHNQRFSGRERDEKEVLGYYAALKLSLKDRTARALCQQWVQEGFLVIVDPAKKTRRYTVAKKFK